MTMMPSFVPGNLAMMLSHGKFAFRRVGGENVGLDLIAFEMGEDVVFNLLVIRAADGPRAEGHDLFHVLHGAVASMVGGGPLSGGKERTGSSGFGGGSWSRVLRGRRGRRLCRGRRRSERDCEQQSKQGRRASQRRSIVLILLHQLS